MSSSAMGSIRLRRARKKLSRNNHTRYRRTICAHRPSDKVLFATGSRPKSRVSPPMAHWLARRLVHRRVIAPCSLRPSVRYLEIAMPPLSSPSMDQPAPPFASKMNSAKRGLVRRARQQRSRSAKLWGREDAQDLRAADMPKNRAKPRKIFIGGRPARPRFQQSPE